MLISPAFAQAAGGSAAGGGAANVFVSMAPLLLIFVVFWFFLIRPQQQQAKRHRAKIDAVKKGDQVITGGGLLGKVTKVEDIYVDVELGTGVKVRAVKAMLTDVLTAPVSAPAND